MQAREEVTTDKLNREVVVLEKQFPLFWIKVIWYTVIIIAKTVTNDLLCNHECATCTEQMRGDLYEHRWEENKDQKDKYRVS